MAWLPGLSCWRCARRLASRMNIRRLIVVFLVILLCIYYGYVSNSEPVRPKMKILLRPQNFCHDSNLSSPIPDDLTYWGSPPSNPNGRNSVRILLFSSSPGPTQAKAITDFLVANRLKYKLAYSGRNLPDLIRLSKGMAKYLVIVFQDIRDLYHMDRWNRELLDKYCSQFKVGILGFLPSGDDEDRVVSIDDSSTNSSSPFKYSSHQSISSPATGDHPLLRIIKSNLTIPGPQPGNGWVRFEFLGEGVTSVLSTEGSDGTEAPIVIEDTGVKDHIKKIVIGGSNAMQQWYIKLLFLDALHYLSSGEITIPLTRYIMVDIDDIFVGSARLVKSDVTALVESQYNLSKVIPGFHYNLGFSGKYFLSGSAEEDLADLELVASADKFWWFPHMWKHIQPHRFTNTSDLTYRMGLNRQFAKSHSLPVYHRYAVSPHHSGVYPVHHQLYEAWREVWDIAITSTEEYPNLRPDRRRRGFQYSGVSVLPRQTCGLFTKNLNYADYPGTPARLEQSIAGGELFQTVVTNPISIFMTHMPNYCCDRLAPYTFQSLASMVQCNTNINLKTVPPPELASTYFKLFPEETQAIWGNPCDDKRHLEIWSETKNCKKLPNFLVIGPQKTGTTALYSFLQLHPSIVSNYPSQETFEEVQFFKGSNYAKGVNWYMDHFPEGNKSVSMFEKSATYFDGESVPGRAHRLLPHANIIAVIIPPGQRAYSWYQHMRAHSDPTSLAYTFKQVITAPPDSPHALLALQSRCLEPGKYPQHLERWLAQFRPRQIHIIDGEEIKYNPVAVMNKLQHYLQIQPFFDYNNSLVFDKAKGFFCMKIGQKEKVSQECVFEDFTSCLFSV